MLTQQQLLSKAMYALQTSEVMESQQVHAQG